MKYAYILEVSSLFHLPTSPYAEVEFLCDDYSEKTPVRFSYQYNEEFENTADFLFKPKFCLSSQLTAFM